MMFGSFTATLCALTVLTASERPSASEEGPPLTMEVVKALHSAEAQVPKLDGEDHPENGWFSPTGQEIGDDGIMKHAVENVRRQAAAMKDISNHVVDKLHTHEENVGDLHDILDNTLEDSTQLKVKVLAELVEEDENRMKWMNTMLGDERPSLEGNDLDDYIPKVQSLDSVGVTSEGRAQVLSNELSTKHLPFDDLLYPHRVSVSRRSQRATMVDKIPEEEATGSNGRNAVDLNKIETDEEKKEKEAREAKVLEKGGFKAALSRVKANGPATFEVETKTARA